MRMNKDAKLTAEMIVNEYSKEELQRIFWNYGEEKFAGPIARKIVEVRQEKRITIIS